ncbi:MAG: hypothetical protein HQL97_06460 [Magnetococcales bacterium]|nr:hypothetical protein [Magnetococcales bacterium]
MPWVATRWIDASTNCKPWHGSMESRARREGVPLNALVSGLLAEGIGRSEGMRSGKHA